MSYLLDHGFNLIKQGAEAKIYSGTYLGKPTIVKERFSKKYRHPNLDSMLTKERTKSEAKSILKALNCGLKTPALYLVDYLNGTIYMENVNGVTIKEYLYKTGEKYKNIDNNIVNELDNDKGEMKLYASFYNKIGKALALLHKNHIIHGDLTTSNMMLTNTDDNLESVDSEVVLLDFGLSHISNSTEDKGVDLYVFERAFSSTHSDLMFIFKEIMKKYKADMKSCGGEVILAKYEEVRARGRKRTMVG